MLRSEGRILTTHAGSLPRPLDLTRLYAERAAGQAVDEARIAELLAGRDEFETGSIDPDSYIARALEVLGSGANAGVQIRSQRIPDHHEVRGYQADLGEETISKALAIQSFDPGEGWTPVE